MPRQNTKTWFDAAGNPTASKYVPDYERAAEKYGQNIVSMARDLEASIVNDKLKIKAACERMLLHHISKSKDPDAKRFTFSTYDKEYKIEADLTNDYFRVYRATKKNPGHKDYEIVNLDFSKSFDIAKAHADLNKALPDIFASSSGKDLPAGETAPVLSASQPGGDGEREEVPAGPDHVRED